MLRDNAQLLLLYIASALTKTFETGTLNPAQAFVQCRKQAMAVCGAWHGQDGDKSLGLIFWEQSDRSGVCGGATASSVDFTLYVKPL